MRALAQLDQGVIGGVVRDKTGAVIPGAQVILTDTETGTTLQARSNASGIYAFPSTKIGVYQITVSAAGFKTLTQQNIHLNIQDRLNVVLVLSPGIVSQIIMVSSEPPLLQTQSASVGKVVSSQSINNTPLDERNWVFIAQTTPGVVEAFVATASGTGDTAIAIQDGDCAFRKREIHRKLSQLFGAPKEPLDYPEFQSRNSGR